MKSKITVGLIVLLITIAGSSFGWYLGKNSNSQSANVLGDSEGKSVVTEVLQGEKGEQGEQGEKGERGDRGPMPEGHWEKYCVYPENESGYRTRGAMIRKSSGDCRSSWKVVEVWEK